MVDDWSDASDRLALFSPVRQSVNTHGMGTHPPQLNGMTTGLRGCWGWRGVCEIRSIILYPNGATRVNKQCYLW
jgi:hypothetical protein